MQLGGNGSFIKGHVEAGLIRSLLLFKLALFSTINNLPPNGSITFISNGYPGGRGGLRGHRVTAIPPSRDTVYTHRDEVRCIEGTTNFVNAACEILISSKCEPDF